MQLTDPHTPKTSEEIAESDPPTFQAMWRQNQALSAQVEALRGELNQTRRAAVTWNSVFHPLTILAVSLGAALIFAALIILDRELSSAPGRHDFYLYYMVPISAPFVAFLLDRARRWQEKSVLQWAVDLPVLALSLVRALYALPGISGHALFLAYALLTGRSRVVKVLAAIVLAQVIYLKIFAWRDPTLFGGLLAATAAAAVFWFAGKKGSRPTG